uniref:Uncharacterized protein n=1 Tax=Glossina pallidipes TaxID=7398 RepID=A0A1B0A858_GLOPL
MRSPIRMSATNIICLGTKFLDITLNAVTVLKCLRSKATNLLKDTFPQIEKAIITNKNQWAYTRKNYQAETGYWQLRRLETLLVLTLFSVGRVNARQIRNATTLHIPNKENIPDCCQVSTSFAVYSADVDVAEASLLCNLNSLARFSTLASANNCCSLDKLISHIISSEACRNVDDLKRVFNIFAETKTNYNEPLIFCKEAFADNATSSEAVRSVGSTQNCIEYKISALNLNLRVIEKANT